MNALLKRFFNHINIFNNLWRETKFAFKSFYPVFIILIIPLVYPAIISLVYSNQSVVERNVVVLDEDNSELSRHVLINLNATQGADIRYSVNSIDEGIRAVMSRQADAFLLIPEDFSTKIERVERGTLKTYVYATNMMIYASVMTAIQETVLDMNNQLALDRLTTPKGITGERAQAIIDPIRYDKTVLYAPTLAYSSFLCTLLFLLVIHQMMLIVPGFSIGYRREIDPEFKERHLWVIDYFAHFIFYLPFVAIAAWYIYCVLCPIFGWPTAPFSQMLALALLVSVMNFPISAILMSLAKDKYTTFQIVLALSVPCLMISGYVWPTYSMPGWVASMSDWFIINPIASAVRKIVFKGLTLNDIGPELYHMIRINIAYLVVAIIVVHRGIITRNIKRFKALKTELNEAKRTKIEENLKIPEEVETPTAASAQ